MYMKHWWNGADGRTTEVLGEKLFQFPLSSPEIQNMLAWNITRAFAATGPATSCLSSSTVKIDTCFISELLIKIRPISQNSAQLASSYAVNCGFVSNLKSTRNMFHCLGYRERHCVHCF